jgi:hypothetical protein
VGEKENSIEVFRRFNVGKIPLSNAELIKALLLKNNTDVSPSLIFSIQRMADDRKSTAGSLSVGIPEPKEELYFQNRISV